MFSVRKNMVLTVSYARTGKQQDGTPYAMLKFLERDNQPEGIENPSRSTKPMYVWWKGTDKFPEAIKDVKDRSKVRLIDADGFDSYADPREVDKKTVWRECLRLENPTFEMA